MPWRVWVISWKSWAGALEIERIDTSEGGDEGGGESPTGWQDGISVEFCRSGLGRGFVRAQG